MTVATSSKAASPTLSRVAKGDLCAGCGGCAAVAPDKITMGKALPGYLRPAQHAPLSETEERTIATICPGLNETVDPADRQETTLWGPYVTAQTGWATDAETRFRAASGGALSAILSHLVESGTVDAVVQTTANPALPVGNAAVVSRGSDDVRSAAGSRYAPSAPLSELPARLDEHRRHGARFAFVGKPCDAVALRALADRDPEVRRAFPVVLSFFCAGVPSQAGAEKVLDALGTDPSETLSFRYRGMGWPGCATAVRTDGSEVSMSYHESWGKILSRHVQHRCKLCPDGTGVQADIVCADAWESDENGYPLFEEKEGVSLVMGRTDLGARLIEEARAANAIETGPFDMASLDTIQPGQRERRRAVLARLWGQRLAGRPVPRYRGLQLLAAARQNSLRRNAKNLLGTLRRALRRPRTDPKAAR